MVMQIFGGAFRFNNLNVDRLDPASNVGGLAMTGSAHKIAFMFQVPKTGTIRKLGFRTAAVTTSDTLKVGLQTLTSNHNPSGTQYGGSTPGTVSGLVANTGYTVTLAADANATVGDRVAMVIEFNSYVAGNLSIANVGADLIGIGYPSTKQFVSSWAIQNRVPIMWVEYSDGSYALIRGVFPFSVLTSQTYNSGSNPDEYGMKFKFPFKTRLRGFRFYNQLNASGNVTAKVYDSDGSTVLTSITMSIDNMTMSKRYLAVIFPSLPTLESDTFYRVTFLNNNANDMTLDVFTLPSVAAQDSLDGGQNCYLTTRNDNGSWTDSTDKRPGFELEFDQIDIPSSGGLLLHPGMAGGMRA